MKKANRNIEIRYELSSSNGYVGSFENLSDLNQHVETMRESDPKRYPGAKVKMIVTSQSEAIYWKPGLKSVTLNLK